MVAGLITEVDPAPLPVFRARGFVFTWNNPGDQALIACTALSKEANWFLMSLEVAPTTGTPHYQGAIYFRNIRSVVALRKKMKGAHVERMKGNCQHSYAYIKCIGKHENKAGGGPIILEKGEVPDQGIRTDLGAIYSALEEGCTMRDILDRTPNLQAIQVAERWFKYKEQPKTWKPQVYWYAGPSGSGKSYSARRDLDGDRWTKPRGPGGWFDGYDAHEDALFDDLRPGDISPVDLLAYIGDGECSCPVKNGYRQFKPQRIIITSLYTPEEFWQRSTACHEEVYQLVRRLAKIVVFQPPDEDVARYEPERVFLPAYRLEPSVSQLFDDTFSSEDDEPSASYQLDHTVSYIQPPISNRNLSYAAGARVGGCSGQIRRKPNPS